MGYIARIVRVHTPGRAAFATDRWAQQLDKQHAGQVEPLDVTQQVTILTADRLVVSGVTVNFNSYDSTTKILVLEVRVTSEGDIANRVFNLAESANRPAGWVFYVAIRLVGDTLSRTQMDGVAIWLDGTDAGRPPSIQEVAKLLDIIQS